PEPPVGADPSFDQLPQHADLHRAPAPTPRQDESRLVDRRRRAIAEAAGSRRIEMRAHPAPPGGMGRRTGDWRWCGRGDRRDCRTVVPGQSEVLAITGHGCAAGGMSLSPPADLSSWRCLHAARPTRSLRMAHVRVITIRTTSATTKIPKMTPNATFDASSGAWSVRGVRAAAMAPVRVEETKSLWVRPLCLRAMAARYTPPAHFFRWFSSHPNRQQ